MNSTGNQFLPRGAFARDQDCCVARSNSKNLRSHAADRVRGADDLLEYGRREDVVVEQIEGFFIEVSWQSPESPVPVEVYPSLAWDNLFDNRGSLLNISILDRVKDRAQDLAKRVSSSDKGKLDEYLNSVREVEKRVDGMRKGKASAEDAAKAKNTIAATMALCSLAMGVAFMDRGILPLFVDRVKGDLHITDVQFSLLTGLAFTMFYALCGIPMGRLVDSKSRPVIIAAGMRLMLSSQRSAFCRDSLNVRPMAMASPTDFMDVVSVPSAPGNFSKLNRGIFVTM